MTALVQKMKPILGLRWEITRDTWVAFAAGFGAILLSVAMIPYFLPSP